LYKVSIKTKNNLKKTILKIFWKSWRDALILDSSREFRLVLCSWSQNYALYIYYNLLDKHIFRFYSNIRLFRTFQRSICHRPPLKLIRNKNNSKKNQSNYQICFFARFLTRENSSKNQIKIWKIPNVFPSIVKSEKFFKSLMLLPI